MGWEIPHGFGWDTGPPGRAPGRACPAPPGAPAGFRVYFISKRGAGAGAGGGGGAGHAPSRAGRSGKGGRLAAPA